ncbi:MAG: WG repeat-containing protein [Bacteroidetes bacterium]|jgi:hypothetical protein|nr:WG repeat-containing protein [Bacteroidota bacterium]
MLNIRLLIFLLFVSFGLSAQQYFPIKKDKKWGLIDADGKIVLQPNYDAIGEFKSYGYAVMQRDGKVGMLNSQGEEVIEPKFDDLKVLDSTMIAVMTRRRWVVVNLKGHVILNAGYERAKALNKAFLAYSINQKWGVVDIRGNSIIEPRFDDISIVKNQYFQTRNEEGLGLMTGTGQEILKPSNDEIQIYNSTLFFFKKGNHWGAVDQNGSLVLNPIYDRFAKISDDFLKLVYGENTSLFSIQNNKTLTNGGFDAYYPLTKDYVIVKKNRSLGLIDAHGNKLLPANFNEIQVYHENLFRVNFNGRWGIVDVTNTVVIPFEYDYIAPMKDGYCVVIQNRKMGLANFKGQVVVEPAFDRMVLEHAQLQAFKGSQLVLFQGDESGGMTREGSFQKHLTIKIGGGKQPPPWMLAGQAESQFVLQDFEWFYSPPHDKWGLRKLKDGSVQIAPTFHEIRVLKEMDLTLVGIEILDYYDYDRTSYRFEMAYGMVNNKVGLLVKEVDMVDLRLSDFKNGFPTARCIFLNGRHGLVNRIGKVVCKDYAFIGEFKNGLARMSMKGRLSAHLNHQTQNLGSLRQYLNKMIAPVFLRDYTLYDKEVDKTGRLTCQNCLWGYMDTIGVTVVTPSYDFAKDFVNDVGIVKCEGKWGMVGAVGEQLLPCRYDGLSFLENTKNRIIRIFQKDEKYGLIDTLGQLTVNLKYDDIGSFCEGRLAVQYNGMWGFVDANGLEVIPCRFKEVKNFSEGLAAVKLGNKWGYIDKLGNIEIGFKFFRAGNFNNDLAFAKNDSQPFGYIDRTGEWVIEPRFASAQDFDRGVARITEWTNDFKRMGLIDLRGAYVVRPKYLSISEFDEYGLSIVAYGSGNLRYSLMNLRGEMVTTNHFKEIYPFKEGLARVKYKDHYGFINQMGDLVISGKFIKAGDFSQKLAYVKVDSKYGYIDQHGKMVIKPQFSRCMDFKEGKAVVFHGNKKGGLIDRNGKMLIVPSINQMIEFTEGRGLVRQDTQFIYITEQAQVFDGEYQKARKFINGVAVIKENGRWGIINQKGIEIIPPKYDYIDQFEDGFAKVQINGFNGLTNLQGELIIQPDYEYISYAGEGLFRVEQGDKIGYFNMEGNWVWGLTD